MKYANKTAILIAATSLVLAGCGGGGGGSAPNVPQVPAATATPVPVQGTAAFTIVIPPKSSHVQRGPSFVSSATKSIKITRSVPTPVQSQSSNVSSSTCTSSSPCTVYGPGWTVGTSNTYNLTTYDNTGGTGNALDSADITFTPTGAQTTQAVTMQGIPYTVAITGVPAAWNANTSGQTTNLTVTVADHSGQTITGTYYNIVQILDPDPETTNGTNLTGTHAGSGCTNSCVRLTMDTDTIALNYGGLAENPVVLSSSVLTGSLGTAGTATFTPILQAIVKDNGPASSLGGDGIDLFTNNSSSATGYSGTEQYTELGFTNGPYGKTLSATGAGACSTFATLATGTNDTTHGTPFTATAVASPLAGQCTITVTDALTDQTNALPTFLVTYTTSGGIINGRPGH